MKFNKKLLPCFMLGAAIFAGTASATSITVVNPTKSSFRIEIFEYDHSRTSLWDYLTDNDYPNPGRPTRSIPFGEELLGSYNYEYLFGRLRDINKPYSPPPFGKLTPSSSMKLNLESSKHKILVRTRGKYSLDSNVCIMEAGDNAVITVAFDPNSSDPKKFEYSGCRELIDAGNFNRW